MRLGSREEYLRDLFPDSFADTAEDSSSSSSSSGRGSDSIDCSTYKCLDRLIVRPVTVLGKLAVYFQCFSYMYAHSTITWSF